MSQVEGRLEPKETEILDLFHFLWYFRLDSFLEAEMFLELKEGLPIIHPLVSPCQSWTWNEPKFVSLPFPDTPLQKLNLRRMESKAVDR